MPQTKYTYSIATDTANGAANTEKLKAEIQDSAILIALDYITTTGDVLDIYMMDALSTSAPDDVANLLALVNAHDGEPYPDSVSSVKVQHVPPFGDKKTPDGLKLFSRTEGKSFSVNAGANDGLDFNVPWNNAKLTGLEIIGGEIGDKVDLKVRDDPSGTISTVADLVLNQFGYTVYVAKDFYRKESAYDADLIKDMKIELEYDSVSAKTIYVNYILHEVKP